MRYDTIYGPVWVLPDMLGEKAAKQYARLELLWPDLEGFVAEHVGPASGGAYFVRAPRAALEAREYKTGSAAENPTEEGCAWPPIVEVEDG